MFHRFHIAAHFLHCKIKDEMIDTQAVQVLF